MSIAFVSQDTIETGWECSPILKPLKIAIAPKPRPRTNRENRSPSNANPIIWVFHQSLGQHGGSGLLSDSGVLVRRVNRNVIHRDVVESDIVAAVYCVIGSGAFQLADIKRPWKRIKILFEYGLG
jgi:hypothetical protein